MKNNSLLSVLAISFALFAAACGSGNGTPDASGTGAPTVQPGGPALPPTGAPGHHQSAGACNSNPGCSTSDSGGSCTLGGKTCVDYNGGNSQALAEFRTACEKNHGQSHGQYSNGPCSMSNLVGSCKTEGGTPSESVVRFYSGPGMSLGIVQAACNPANGNCAVFCAP